MALLKGDDGKYLSYSELPSRAKAEALMPVLVSSCLSLSSSPYKPVLQDIFGRLVFQNRSALCGFFITQKGSVSLLTPQATSYLHGRSLMNLMGVPEEAFIRFVIITDFLRYHFDAVGALCKKYRHLLSANDYNNVATLLKEYDGVKALTRPEKGFRNRDVKFFQAIKTTVTTERHSMRLGSSTDNKAATNVGTNVVLAALDKQFIFHYPGFSVDIKNECTLNNTKSRKRKATGNWPPNPEVPSPSNHESLSMPIDDEDYVNYKTKFISK
jgi:hypothetical protein